MTVTVPVTTAGPGRAWHLPARPTPLPSQKPPASRHNPPAAPTALWRRRARPAAQGAGINEFIREMQRHFTKVARMRVDASRSMSREFYAVGLGRKAPGKK